MSAIETGAIHPGEILRELYLEPLDLKPYSLARTLGVPRTRIERIVAEKVGITTDTALRLAGRHPSSGSICRSATISRYRARCSLTLHYCAVTGR